MTQRLSADDRRRQLIGIGLQKLVERPIHELSLDEVATEAGISRGLLFHYFPTKKDFYVAVLEAAARRLLKQTAPDPEAAPAAQLHQSLDAFVAFLERRREPYLALMRGTAGGADYVIQVHEDTRAAFTGRVHDALGPESETPRVRLLVRGWFSLVEDTALEWARDRPLPREELIELLMGSLTALLSTADPDLAGRLEAEEA
ncbi:TetR/AcrR family transcriptional regulator [Streptomyces sp. A7024]|uniref:TetR/AcrR family transcriptional regulator n=1 Tax=Streptomyces coryli TaxID=1128680 RepID=A0A6G4TT38_9ACTN|nr:TetR/AcrR family transcriptional regulator [Streptomyces coryli]NGN62942.1 TetR/AcrR family transcriptional regulator [Streptomyces coryli]